MRTERVTWCLSTTEVFPFSKIGGLGDYSYTFAKALCRRGHEVIVYSPYYERHMLPALQDIELKVERRTVSFRKVSTSYEILTGRYEGITFIFFRHPEFWGYEEMFKHDCTRYNENLNGSTLLAKALCQDLRIRYDTGGLTGRRLIVQGNDAPASFFAPFLQAEDFPHITLTKLYCIHSFVGDAIGRIYRFDHYYLDYELMEIIGPSFDREKTWLELLAPYYDQFMTVSPHYAVEITEGDAPINRIFRRHQAEGRFQGFLNGLEQHYWSIASSPLLKREPGESLAEVKSRYKAELCARTGMPVDQPLLLFIGRITEQKGLHLLNNILHLDPDLRVVILGQGEPLEHYLEKDVRCRVIHYDRYEERLCHRLLAAADYSIVPSEYEPCGYVAMYAPSFGVIPFVRATGGLVDIANRIEQVLPEPIRFETAESFLALFRSYVEHRVHENCGLIEALIRMDWGWDNSLEQIEAAVLNSPLHAGVGGGTYD